MSPVVVLILLLAGLSEAAGRLLPLVARRPGMSRPRRCRTPAGRRTRRGRRHRALAADRVDRWPSTCAPAAEPDFGRIDVDTRAGRAADPGRHPRVPAARSAAAPAAPRGCRSQPGRTARRGFRARAGGAAAACLAVAGVALAAAVESRAAPRRRLHRREHAGGNRHERRPALGCGARPRSPRRSPARPLRAAGLQRGLADPHAPNSPEGMPYARGAAPDRPPAGYLVYLDGIGKRRFQRHPRRRPTGQGHHRRSAGTAGAGPGAALLAAGRPARRPAGVGLAAPPHPGFSCSCTTSCRSSSPPTAGTAPCTTGPSARRSPPSSGSPATSPTAASPWCCSATAVAPRSPPARSTNCTPSCAPRSPLIIAGRVSTTAPTTSPMAGTCTSSPARSDRIEQARHLDLPSALARCFAAAHGTGLAATGRSPCTGSTRPRTSGRRSYISPTAKLPDGRSHLERTAATVIALARADCAEVELSRTADPPRPQRVNRGPEGSGRARSGT